MDISRPKLPRCQGPNKGGTYVGTYEFNIGILGGENAQDRMTSNECFRAAIEAELGVPVKLFTPADYDGVIQGLLGGTSTWLGWAHRPMPRST